MLAALLVLAMAPVTVYVGPEVKADGFVSADKETQDSIKDLRTALGKRLGKSGFALTNDPALAEVRLVVVDRSLGYASTGVSGYAVPIGGGIYAHGGESVAVYKRLTVEARVGEHKQPFIETGASWARMADTIAKDVTVWLTANRERIVAEK